MYTFSKMNQIMHLRLLWLSFISIFPFISAFSQGIAIGDWRDHLPYKKVISLTASNENIYCATPYSIFYYNKNDNSLSRLTQISGLSDVGISKIKYNEINNTLLVAYSNTNIDLVKGQVIVNMRDIINSDAITPEEKSINNILFIEKRAYLSCGFGIVVLDLEREEVSDTYFIGPNGSHLTVYELTKNDTSFFAATENGIYTAYLDDPNLAFYESWTKNLSVPSPDATYNSISIFNEMLFINKRSDAYAQDTLYYLENAEWKNNFSDFPTDDIVKITFGEENLFVVYTYYAKVYNPALTQMETIWTYGNDIYPELYDMIEDDGVIWLGDARNGLVERIDSYSFNFYYPNGPDNADVFSLSSSGSTVYSVPGGRDLSWGNIYKAASISTFKEDSWTTLDRTDIPAFDTMFDVLSVAANPANPDHVFAGTWATGMIEMLNGQLINVYNPTNSGLDYKNNEGTVCKVGGVAFDQSGRLWATSSHANNVLAVRINDGTSLGQWYSYNLGSFSSSSDLGPLMVDSYGQKWIITRETKPIIVFNDNGTPSITSDDKIKELTSAAGSGGIPGDKVFSMAEDKDGEVWIGSDEGVSIFYSPGNIFTPGYNFDAQRILIPRDDGSGLADILLEFETVTAIAVDGNNNKWIGTDRSGVFHLSPDGQTELHHFTEQNSPLLSNNITSITITNDGEVFFGTAKGIISFRGSATPDNPTFEDVYAFPNPVRPDYDGPVAIRGLVDQANFKVTDISGTLVYSGKAEGGQAIWNCTNFSGRRVQSGVYLVFLTNDDGSETLVTKLLFIN